MKTTDSISLEIQFHLRKRKWLLLAFICLLIGISLCFLLLHLGNTKYSADIILRVLHGESISGATFAIRKLRLPRMLAAILSGFSFGMAGGAFQTMLRNPLASPDVIGVTSSTSFAAIFCILILNMSGPMVSVASVAFGVLISLVIYFFSRGKKDSFSGGRLILIGIGLQSMIRAASSYVLLKANQYDVAAAMRWLSGDLNAIQMNDLYVLFAICLFSCVGLFLLNKHLNILELGEESAFSLGIATSRIRLLILLLSVLLIAFTTSVTGPIAFVSFLAGPIALRIFGKNNFTILSAGIIGVLLVSGSDLIAQHMLSTAYPVGVITGILGAPYLLFLIIKINKNGGF